MRRRRAPIQPHVTPTTAASTTVPEVGLSRGAPPPPPAPPEQARLFVYRLMMTGATREQIADTGEVNVPPFGRELVYRLYSTICKELGDAANLPEFSRETLRMQATYRLKRDVSLLRSRQNTTGISHIDYVRLDRAITKESLLADVEGTKQLEVHVDVDVDVRVRSASMRVIANLTRDELEEIGREMLDGRRG
jgi:hypothetical protein